MPRLPPSRGRLERRAFLGLLAITAAWGSTFVLIKDVVTRIGVADLLTVRFAIAALALLVVFGRRLRLDRRTLVQGTGLGILYGVAQLLQTVGLAHTTASVSGFLTGLYVVATPLLGAALLRTRVPGLLWLAAVLATLGLGVLSVRPGGAAGPPGSGLGGAPPGVGFGEALTVASAIVYAGHIVALGRFGDAERARSLAFVQLVVITVVSGIAAVPGGLSLPGSARDWAAVLYLAIVAGTLTMLLQTWAQAHLAAARAAVIMAAEPVWAAGFAVGLGGERLTTPLVLGGLTILSAMYLVEVVPVLRRRRGRPPHRRPPEEPQEFLP